MCTYLCSSDNSCNVVLNLVISQFAPLPLFTVADDGFYHFQFIKVCCEIKYYVIVAVIIKQLHYEV